MSWLVFQPLLGRSVNLLLRIRIKSELLSCLIIVILLLPFVFHSVLKLHCFLMFWHLIIVVIVVINLLLQSSYFTWRYIKVCIFWKLMYCTGFIYPNLFYLGKRAGRCCHQLWTAHQLSWTNFLGDWKNMEAMRQMRQLFINQFLAFPNQPLYLTLWDRISLRTGIILNSFRI